MVIKALTAALVLSALPALAMADDYGPHPDLRAIRHDLPIIEKGAIVDDVAVKGNDALVQAHIDADQRIYLMRRRYDRWWVEDQWWSGGARCAGFPLDESSIIPLGREHLPAMKTFPAESTAVCDSNAQLHTEIQFLGSAEEWSDTIFWERWTFAKNDATMGDSFADVTLRAPTEAESWMTQGGNSYFFFSMDVRSGFKVTFNDGTALDVGFPFALNADKKYSLTIGHADAPIGPIDGALKDNTLHFVLPAFSLTPGAHLMGEIEGNPAGP